MKKNVFVPYLQLCFKFDGNHSTQYNYFVFKLHRTAFKTFKLILISTPFAIQDLSASINFPQKYQQKITHDILTQSA